MIVIWRVEKGKSGPLTENSDEFLTLHRRISQYKRGKRNFRRNFKIGITNDPERRANEYDSRDGGRYHQMVVLYQTGGRQRIRDMEAMLVRKHLQGSDNEQGGGGGLVGRRGPYYLYIVRSRLIRRFRWWG